MAPKHSFSSDPPSAEDHHAIKRIKSSPSLDRDPQFKHATPLSRSETPAESSSGKIPFTVVYPAMTTASKSKLIKEKLLPNEELVQRAEFQRSPFEAKGATEEGELDQHYVVLPNEEWLGMKKYNNFIIQGEVYKNDTIVYVRAETTKIIDPNTDNDHQFWIARILQVRAKNPQNVYALVTWLYWPQELPGLKGKWEPGAQEYHGKFELVASNYMEVLDVLSFAGKADVSQYLEEDDDIRSRLYWRQTFCRQTQELSKLREHCICKGHFNPDPDKQMFICDNQSCKTWLHKDCLINSALLKTYERLVGSVPSNRTSGPPSKKKNGKKVYAGKFSGKLVEGKGKGTGDEHDVLVEIMDLRAGKKRETWRQPAVCLKCETELTK